jgi:hypothetical protein
MAGHSSLTLPTIPFRIHCTYSRPYVFPTTSSQHFRLEGQKFKNFLQHLKQSNSGFSLRQSCFISLLMRVHCVGASFVCSIDGVLQRLRKCFFFCRILVFARAWERERGAGREIIIIWVDEAGSLTYHLEAYCACLLVASSFHTIKQTNKQTNKHQIKTSSIFNILDPFYPPNPSTPHTVPPKISHRTTLVSARLLFFFPFITSVPHATPCR